MKSATEKRKGGETPRASCVSSNMDVHSYASPGDKRLSTPFPESPGNPPSKKGRAEDDDSVISTLSQLINNRSDALEKMLGRPRAIIIQFSSRVARDGVWRAAKSSEFLRGNGLRFTKDLTAFDREKRLLLWPAVEKARKEGKRAYFVGHRAFTEGSEINPS
ncbi:hypothetical protein QQF64_027191 [Cirrhinus molitorella]|uniref:Uncharacterized protein n=1 Tax=Cirrhinus molitorella TaxID=172907 RepID=A0ABR3NCA8_9TELE